MTFAKMMTVVMIGKIIGCKFAKSDFINVKNTLQTRVKFQPKT